jgi:hypothetical protein
MVAKRDAALWLLQSKAFVLWVLHGTRRKELHMKHKRARITLLVIELFVGVWAVIGGVGLVTGAIPFLRMPVEYLQDTPFADYTVPGLLLLLAVGGSNLLAAATILFGREVGVLTSALAGLLLVGFEIVEAPIIDRYGPALATAMPQQLLMAILGIVCFGLAVSLWMREYRGQSMFTRHLGHA